MKGRGLLGSLPTCTVLMVLNLVEPILSLQLEWSVVGDSWASGVAYNSSNVYGKTDSEFCYRTTEAWGAQMEADSSWASEGQPSFKFAACGGTLMEDVERQMKEKAGLPDIVWGMFGGNDAYFGAIARACIYQPYAVEHPFGWGPAWDEDPKGEGLCKQNIKKAQDYLNNPQGFRAAFMKTLDDILRFAQNYTTLNTAFDLYTSSYVRFFDNTTDACDEWSFAHDRVSVGQPKLVKGLRKTINDAVQQINDIQADAIKNYKIPEPAYPNVKVHNSQPDSLFDGHRFCEKDRTFEDQYYGKDLWLWNLQYYDEKSGEEVAVATTNSNGVKFMKSSDGVDVTQGYQTVLGADFNPDAAVPQGSDPHTQQYGFGWTARPFHPKYDGHKALKEHFIQQMRNDHTPGIKPADSADPKPPAPPPLSPPKPPQIKHECKGLADSKYVTYAIVKDNIDNHFCPDAADKGPIERKYNEGTMEEHVITLQGPGDFKPSKDDCKTHLHALIDNCDGNDPKNPQNFKGGGKERIADVMYQITPNALRQPAVNGIEGGCVSAYKALFNEYTVWGQGWDTSDHGDGLKNQLGGCALLPDTWHFDYGLGNDGREWTAKFRTGVFQKKCVGDAMKSAGGPGVGCTGSG